MAASSNDQMGGNRLISGDFNGLWREFRPVGLPPERCALVATDHVTALAAVWEHHLRGDTELLIVPASRFDDRCAVELEEAGFAVAGRSCDSAAPATPGRTWVSTSGSSGRPKRVAHTLAGLTTVRQPQEPRRWLLPFTPGSYAWWQLVTLSMTVPGQDLVTVEPHQLHQWVDLAVAEQVTAVSATPTFWRRALLHDRQKLAALPLKQITLGGEPVEQRLLDDLARCFPDARVTWIFASTETGAAFAVHDGQAGFPASWLDKEASGRPLLRVREGELFVRSPYQGVDLAGFVRTGDRAEIRDGRVHITGRLAHDQLNVGGAKVAASDVREVLIGHPAVVWARVYSRRAPVVGELVAAEVATTTPADAAELRTWCAAQLPEFAVPRFISFVDDLSLNGSLKSAL